MPIYKILLLKQDRAENSLYTFLTSITAATETTPTVTTVWETSDIVILEAKIIELLKDYSTDEFKVVSDYTYTLDVLFA